MNITQLLSQTRATGIPIQTMSFHSNQFDQENMKDMIFYNCQFEGVVLDGCLLHETIFAECSFHQVIFRNTVLNNVTFSQCTAQQCRFEGSVINGLQMVKVFWPDLDLSGIRTEEVSIVSSTMTGLRLSDASRHSRFTLVKSDISGGSLANSTFRSSNFLELDLGLVDTTKSSFLQCTMVKVKGIEQDFSNLNFTECNFHEAELTGTSFARAQVEGAIFTNAQLDRTSFYQAQGPRILFMNSSLYEATFEEAMMPNSIFKECKASNACFDYANVTEGVFTKAELSGSTFIGCELEYADFSHADLRFANLERAMLFRANLHGIIEEQTLWNGAYLAEVKETDKDRLALEQR